jgi:exonuclease SbcC
MTNVDAIREQVHSKLLHVVDLGNGVLRGERRYNDRKFASAYVDLSDDIIARSQNLSIFQEGLLGKDFFEGDGDQRWNSYLYFWAGPRSKAQAGFSEAKSRIERDRHFARKFVLAEDDLLSRIDDLSESRPKTVISDDVRSKWSDHLQLASLGSVLEQKPRAQMVRLIESGDAFAATAVPSQALAKSIDPLGAGVLQSLRVGKFRATTCDSEYIFGDVNLIVGQNGSGKTSMLELIEALYCGRVSRDPDATFSGIQAKVRMPDGRIEDVKGSTSTTTIKARNLAWYGRSDFQASMISGGFTRFNFLDTDAAFRLSSEKDPEKIKDDLSRLLVGPETSALWTYLTKLHEDAVATLRSLDERLPALVKQTELLGTEVKRLREVPSQATSLTKTYRASLKALGAKWELGDAASLIDGSDRTRLEGLSRGFQQALAVPSIAPPTVKALRARFKALDKALAKLGDLHQRQRTLNEDLESRQSEASLCRETIQSLQRWSRYCEAGVPGLIASMNRVTEQIEAIQSSLGGLTIDSIPMFPPEYVSCTISDALRVAEQSLSSAQAQEQSGVESLNQREQTGQSLQSLKSELRAIASAVIQRAGDAAHCPVCGTFHDHDELVGKIDALDANEDPSVNEGLRLAIQELRQRANRERKVIAAIKSLGRYASSSGAPESMTVTQLREQLSTAHNQLNALATEQDQMQSAIESLDQVGLDLDGYDISRDTALSLLGQEKEPFDADRLKQAIEEWNGKLQAEMNAILTLQDSMTENTGSAYSVVEGLGIVALKTSTPDGLVSAVARARNLVDASIKFIEDAAKIDVPDDKSFDAIQSAIDEAIEALDRAQHAEASESSARDEMSQRSEELQRAALQVQDATSKRERFAKVEEVLRNIRKNYSLEDATRNALNSIRKQVSYVFERIHTPSEYDLGDFHGDSILVTRDGQEPRNANQVSTGQRAALALSIFLSLNQSAERAPPIMLIDDPVAHVDDLNVLSFFDYLRDLAVSERKQIFFATADTRVAALFQKKFEFLGQERFRQIFLSRRA